MNVLDLFSGIGGFSLGLERAGMRTVAFCEIDPYCRAVLRKHWPEPPIFEDVAKLAGRDVPYPVDVVCGGFPCQPFSSASRGRRLGIESDDYLWPEMCRVIEDTRPTWVIGENVTHIASLALTLVESDLASLGYSFASLEIPACAVGADHRRSRIWFLGHADGDRESVVSVNAKVARMQRSGGNARSVGTAHGVSSRVDRLRSLGNAVVPQVVEVIGRAIMSTES